MFFETGVLAKDKLSVINYNQKYIIPNQCLYMNLNHFQRLHIIDIYYVLQRHKMCISVFFNSYTLFV